MKIIKSKCKSFIVSLNGGYGLIQKQQTNLITKQYHYTMAGGKYDETQK